MEVFNQISQEINITVNLYSAKEGKKEKIDNSHKALT